MKVRHKKLRNVSPLYVEGEKGKIDADGFVKGLKTKTLEWLVKHVPGYEVVKEADPTKKEPNSKGNGGAK